MNAAKHKAEAERLSQMASDYVQKGQQDEDYAHEKYLLAKAQVHATLATLPDSAPVDPPADPLWDAPLYQAAALLERFALGDHGEQRERNVARLILCNVLPGSDAPDLAIHAIHAARDAGGGNKTKAVAEAIRVLGIDTDAD